jgi:hypothetical protein
MCLPESHKIIFKNKEPMCVYFNIQYPPLKSNDQINSTPIGYAIIGVPDSYMVVFR